MSNELELPLWPKWMNQGLCAQTDPDAWFPDSGGPRQDVIAVCTNCPVKQTCLQYALDNYEEYGIWGGLSERQRRPLSTGRKPYPQREAA